MDDRSAAPAPQAVRIDGYTDLVRIGSGGFSVVYRAHEVALNRNVAVKVLNAGLVSEQERRAVRARVQGARPARPPRHRPRLPLGVHRRRPAVHRDGAVRRQLPRGARPDRRAPARSTLLDVGVRMAVALHIAHSQERAAPRRQAAQHLPLALRRPGARRLRHRHGRSASARHSAPGWPVGGLRRAGAAGGGPARTGDRRLRAGGNALPPGHRRARRSPPRSSARRCARSSPRRRRRSAAPICRSSSTSPCTPRWPRRRPTARRRAGLRRDAARRPGPQRAPGHRPQARAGRHPRGPRRPGRHRAGPHGHVGVGRPAAAGGCGSPPARWPSSPEAWPSVSPPRAPTTTRRRRPRSAARAAP